MTKRQIGAVDLPVDIAFAGVMVCPICGDTKFGTTTLSSGELIRSCHGRLNSEEPCTFKWPASEDHKYFFVPIRYLLKKF